MMISTVITRIVNRLRGQQTFPPGIQIGKGVSIQDCSRFDWSHGRHICIEDNAVVSTGVRILCHDASSFRRIGATWVAPVTIGKGAFVGAESVIMPGVVIGEGAIVASGAVVTCSIDPGAIVAGVPAKKIGEVAVLDEKRRAMMNEHPIFKAVDYNKDDLDSDLVKELQQAISEYGGYFLI